MTSKIAARYSTELAALRDRREAGQNSLEYLGMALVAGVVIAAIYGVITGSGVGEKIQAAWDNITGAS